MLFCINITNGSYNQKVTQCRDSYFSDYNETPEDESSPFYQCYKSFFVYLNYTGSTYEHLK